MSQDLFTKDNTKQNPCTYMDDDNDDDNYIREIK